MNARYIYLQLDLIGSEWTTSAVRHALQAACRELFGEAGAALPLDVLHVEPKSSATGVALLRVPCACAVKARAALTLAAPALRVTRQAGSLQALV